MPINIGVEPRIVSQAQILKSYGHFSYIQDGGHLGFYGYVIVR